MRCCHLMYGQLWKRARPERSFRENMLKRVRLGVKSSRHACEVKKTGKYGASYILSHRAVWSRLEQALQAVRVGDYFEIDPFGVTSKIESALCEAAFFTMCQNAGFSVTRMPENVAMHVGTQNYYDFRLERGHRVYRVELKSLWGTDTTKARLIHTVSKSGGGKNSVRKDRQVWKTSSCRFKDQDIFAVSLWLRTGCITDFAFAISCSANSCARWGLPSSAKHPDHVTQNPPISFPPSRPWTTEINEVCRLFDRLMVPRLARVRRSSKS